MFLSETFKEYQQKECVFCHIKQPECNFPPGRGYCYDCYKYMKKDPNVIDIKDYVRFHPTFKFIRFFVLSEHDSFNAKLSDFLNFFDVDANYIFRALEKLAENGIITYQVFNKGNKNRRIKCIVNITINREKANKVLEMIQRYTLINLSNPGIVNAGLEPDHVEVVNQIHESI